MVSAFITIIVCPESLVAGVVWSKSYVNNVITLQCSEMSHKFTDRFVPCMQWSRDFSLSFMHSYHFFIFVVYLLNSLGSVQTPTIGWYLRSHLVPLQK